MLTGSVRIQEITNEEQKTIGSTSLSGMDSSLQEDSECVGASATASDATSSDCSTAIGCVRSRKGRDSIHSCKAFQAARNLGCAQDCGECIGCGTDCIEISNSSIVTNNNIILPPRGAIVPPA